MNPVTDLTLGQRLRRGLYRDGLRSAVSVLAVTNALTFYHLLRATMDDPRDYLTYNGSFGPLEYRGDAQPVVTESAFGKPQSVFHAGDKVSWTTILCLAPGVSIVGHAALVRVAQSGTAETQIERRDTPIAAGTHRCGPRMGSFRYPSDGLPGAYEIRRSVSIDPPATGGWWGQMIRRVWPLEIQMEPLVTQLVTTVNTSPPSPSTTDHTEQWSLPQ